MNKASKTALAIALCAFGFAMTCAAAPAIPKTVGDFYLEDDGNELEFDVSPQVNGVGTYEITVQYTSGSCAVDIDSVTLFRDDTEVAKDEHSGGSGMISSNNTYYLKYADFKSGAHKIKVAVHGRGGNNSNGKVILKKLPLLDLVGKWDKENMANGGEYDISSIVPASGKFDITLIYTSGPHAAGIRGLTVLENGKEVAKDIHAGITGVFHSDNVYRFSLPFKQGAKYTLKVDFDPNNDRGNPSDSNGMIWLAGKK